MTRKNISIIAALLLSGSLINAGTAGRMAQFKTSSTLQNGPASMNNRQITFVLDGGGAVLATGAKDVAVRSPYAITLTGWTIESFPRTSTASVSVDIWKGSFGSYPTASNTIVGASTPTLTSVVESSGTTSGWTTSVAVGDIFEVSLLSVDVSTKVVVNLYGTVQ